MTEKDKIIQDLRRENESLRKDHEVLWGLIDALRAELEAQSKTLEEVRRQGEMFAEEREWA